MANKAFQKVAGGRIIAFHSSFAHLFDVDAGLLLSQAAYYENHIPASEKTAIAPKNEDGKRDGEKKLFYYHTNEQWMAETGLHEYRLRMAKKFLVINDVLVVEIYGVRAKGHYRVDFDQLERLLSNPELVKEHKVTRNRALPWQVRESHQPARCVDAAEPGCVNAAQPLIEQKKEIIKDSISAAANAPAGVSEGIEDSVEASLSGSEADNDAHQDFAAEEGKSLSSGDLPAESTATKITSDQPSGQANLDEKAKETVAKKEMREFFLRKFYSIESAEDLKFLTGTASKIINAENKRLYELSIRLPHLKMWWAWYRTSGKVYAGTKWTPGTEVGVCKVRRDLPLFRTWCKAGGKVECERLLKVYAELEISDYQTPVNQTPSPKDSFSNSGTNLPNYAN